jgi:hypothetical protein
MLTIYLAIINAINVLVVAAKGGIELWNIIRSLGKRSRRVKRRR